jgi:PAS domain S-box-containing protein
MKRSVPKGEGAKEAPMNSEQEIRLLVETIPALVWRAGPEGNIEYVNKRVLEYLGASLGEVIGWGWMDKVHPDDVAFKVTTWLDNLELGAHHDAICRFRGADGIYRWFEVRGEPLRADDSAVLGWYGVLIDIDDRRNAEESLRESEYKLRQVIETVPGLLWTTAPDGEPTQVNQQVLDYGGMRFEDFLHFGWRDFLHPDDFSETSNAFYHAIQTGTPYQAVHRLRRVDGEYRWHHARGDPLRDAHGRIIQWFGLSVDIDEAKKAEDRLRRSEAYLAEAQRLSHTGSFGWIPSTGEFHWSDETFRILEYGPNIKPTFERVLQRSHPEDYLTIRQLFDEASSGENDLDCVHRLLMPDSSIKFVRILSRALKDTTGNLEVVGAIMDVTANTLLYQDLAEREATLVERTNALRRSESYLAEAQELTHIGVAAYNDTAVLYGSEEIFRIWGFDPAEGVPTLEAVFRRIHPHDFDRMRGEVLRAVGEKNSYSVDYRIVLPDGTIKHLRSIGRPAFSESGAFVEIVATQMDLTERKLAEQAMRESDAKFRDFAETASDWFWEIGSDYKLTLLDENAFGSNSPNRTGAAWWDGALDLQTEPEKWRLLWATLDAREPFRDFVYCASDGDGSPMYVRAAGKPVFDTDGQFRGYRGTSADVTALVRAQEEHERLRQLESDLAHVNRLSMMGELAASLVHEIAQPCASARNNARASMHFLDRNPPDLGQVREALAGILDNADRASDILDRIRDHIQKVPPRKERVDLNKAITDVVALAQSAIIKNGVAVQTLLREKLSNVQADRVQLQQVVLNLILNAVEAMGSSDVGVRALSITTEQHEPNYVLVSVLDSGPGIDRERLDRVFDAFYTTKSNGVGMGLSICRSIIHAHGGRLWVEANAPRGAAFRFTLRNVVGSS